MGRLSTPEPPVDPLTSVLGVHGTPYPCPDIASLDAHIGWLCRRIAYANARFPRLVEAFRADIDRLLDRRCWLEIQDNVEVRLAA
jgi:hypothetical protein